MLIGSFGSLGCVWFGFCVCLGFFEKKGRQGLISTKKGKGENKTRKIIGKPTTIKAKLKKNLNGKDKEVHR